VHGKSFSAQSEAIFVNLTRALDADLPGLAASIEPARQVWTTQEDSGIWQATEVHAQRNIFARNIMGMAGSTRVSSEIVYQVKSQYFSFDKNTFSGLS
jgi:hypothetical protein